MDNNKINKQLLTEIDQLRVKIAELKKNKEFFQLIAENTSDNIGITTFDLKAKYIYVSPSVKSVLGYDPEDLLGKSFFDFIHPDDKKALFPLLKKYISLKVKNLLTGKDSPITETIEFRFKNKAGNWRFMRSTVNIAGKQLLAVTRDVTEHKQVEEALRETVEKHRLLINNSPVGISITDLKGHFTEVNPALCNMAGYSSDEMTGKHFNTFSHPDDLEKNRKLFERLVEGKIEYFDIEKRYIHKNKNIVNVLIRAQLIRDKKGNPLFQTAIIEDVTERKKAGEALKESEQKLRNIFENSTSLFYSHTPEHILTYLSPQVEDILGYTQEEAMIKWTEFISDNPINEVGFKNTEKAIETGKRQPAYELELVKKSGEKIWVEVREFPQLENGKTIAIIGSLTEISERKKAEETIRESEEKYRVLYTSANDAIFLMQDYIIVTCNPKTLEMFGCTEDEIVGHSPIEFSPEHQPGGRLSSEKAIEEMNASLTGEPQFFEWVHQQKDGSPFNAEISLSKMMLSDGEYIQAIVRDITKRKKAEQELIRANAEVKKSKNKYKQFSDATIEGIVFHENGIAIDVNNALQKMIGYTYEELIGQNIIQLLIVKKYHSVIAKNLDRSFSLPYMVEAIKKDGSIIPVEIEGKSLKIKNKIIRVVAVRDITERKLAEETLKESERKFREMANMLPQIVYEIDINGNLTFVNEQAHEIFGYSKAEFEKGINILQTLIPDDRDRAKVNMQNAINGKQVENTEYTALKKDGSTFPILIYSTVILKDDKPVGLRGIIVDITERKKVEAELSKLSSAVQQSPSVIAITDLKGNLEYVNPKFTELTGYTPEEAIGINPRILKSGEQPDEMYKELWKTISSGKEWRGEFLNKKKNGILFWESALISPIIDKQNRIVSYLKVAEDITERKQIEENLKKNEHFLNSILESVQDGVSVLNSDLTIRHVNGVMKKWYKKNLPLERKKCYEAYHNADKPCKKCPTLRCLESGKTEWNIIPGIPGSPVKWIELFSYPIKEANSGKVTGVVEFVRDITERKQVEEELKKKMNELEVFNDAAVDRELLVNDLRKEINELLEKLGVEPKYTIVE